MKKSFKEKTLFDKRIQESEQIRNKYPDRIPIIVEKYKDCKLPDVDKCKYLVPNDMTMSKFIFVVRRRLWHLPVKQLENYTIIKKMKMDFYMSFTQVKIHSVKYLWLI